MLCIKNGEIHDGCGNKINADILIEDGKIKKIGPNLSIDAEEVIDAKGKVVLPGFIDAMSELGMALRRGEARDNDEKTDPVTPELKTLFAYDGDCVMEQTPYTYGITSLAASPSNSNLIGGQMAVFKTYGINPYKMLVKDGVGMKGSLTKAVKDTYGERKTAPMTRMGMFSLLRKTFQEASEYKDTDERNEKKKAMKTVLDGSMPLFVSCNESTEFRGLLRTVEPYGIKPILAHGYDIHAEDDDLLEKVQGVILGNLGYGFNHFSQAADLAGLVSLVKKGLNLCFATIGNNPNGKENLLWTAGKMMQECGDSELVLSMLTRNAAEMLGCADRIGTLEVGKDADIVIWSANPIETYLARTEHVLIQGEVVYTQGGFQQ